MLGVPDAAATRAQVEDQFLIVASDGLWDVMSDQQAVDAVKDVVQTHAHARCDGVEVSSAACAAAEALRALARARGSVDDITVSTACVIVLGFIYLFNKKSYACTLMFVVVMAYMHTRQDVCKQAYLCPICTPASRRPYHTHALRPRAGLTSALLLSCCFCRLL